MKLREKLKRFWTLDVHNHEGFTLVELIIVIAILAILSTGAIAGYSVYIKQANMTADQALVSEIANVLNLYYYSHGITGSDYVILDDEGASTLTSDDDNVLGFAEAALAEAYGENWAEVLKLKYTDWTDDMLGLVARYTDAELANIAGSSFMQYSSPVGLVGAVSNMTGMVSDVIGGSDLSQATDRINTLLGADSHTASVLNSLQLDPNDPEYSTVVSNLLVSEMADMMQNAENDNNPLTYILFTYSTAFAYAEKTGDTSVLDQLNSNLENLSYDNLTSPEYEQYIFAGFDSIANIDDYSTFVEDNQDEDLAALKVMMDAVGQVADSYDDLESLSNSGLYASDEVAEQVNNYVNSVNALAQMSAADRAALSNLSDGTIVIFIDNTGNISVSPDAVLN